MAVSVGSVVSKPTPNFSTGKITSDGLISTDLFGNETNLSQQKLSSASKVNTAVSQSPSASSGSDENWLDNFLSGLQTAFSSSATSALDAQRAEREAAERFTNASQQKEFDFNERMQNEAQEFNAQQADLNRSFQKSERLAQQDYYTEMSNTAYQRAMEDMKKAGLNPILAYAQGGASSAMSAASSGSLATSSATRGSSHSGQQANVSAAKSADLKMYETTLNAIASLVGDTLKSITNVFKIK